MNPPELEPQILALLDGGLSPDETAALEERLLADESAMEIYLEMVALHNALESRFAATASQKASIVPMKRLMAAQQRRVIRGSLIAAAAVVVLAGVAMWMVLAPRKPVELGSIETSSDAVFSLTYEGKGEAPEGRRFVEGSRVRVSDGMIEGVFDGGVHFVAEAPCDLYVAAADKVELREGKAWFHVPPSSVGFTVEAAGLEIVDLGTEFGVVTGGGKDDEVHVLKGSVRATPLTEGAAGVVMIAGEAFRLGAGGVLEPVDLKAGAFPKELARTREVLIANASFEDDVIARDGSVATKDHTKDDYDKDMVPSGWRRFSDGEGNPDLAGGIISLAPDSFFSQVLAPTPDSDANDQTFYSAERDIYQVLGEPLKANSTYVLSVDIGDWRAAAGYAGEPGNPGFGLGVGEKPGEALLNPETTDFPPQIDGRWVRWSATFLTGDDPQGEGLPLRIELTSGRRMAWFDRVRLTVTSAEGR
ncbi:hypothetical protein HAHE_25730 [Haloferula helveola]|uniref:FecR protein domain-containing protein n=1 Tax=Haloferula helveola TaxID=490095 RepID=A0ABM7REY8_9BACT|nr:hypothetical protein HAHE_25730 [Haloferula helveola]